MKRFFALLLVVTSLLTTSAWAVEELRPLGMASATGGYSGDIRVGNTCTTSGQGTFYCALNARHIYFYSDNTVDVDHLYPLAAGTTGFPYVSGGTWAIETGDTYRARFGTGVRDNTTFWRGDGTWSVPPGSSATGNMTKAVYDANDDGVVDSAIATAITDGLVVNADINAAANIAGSKMLDNSVTVGKIQCSGTKGSGTYLRMDGTCTSLSATPGGSSGQIQYNNGGSFGGMNSTGYNSTEETVTLVATKAPSFTATQTSSPGCVKLWEGSGGGSDATGFCAPATIADNTFYTLPGADGSSGDVLQTNGAKVLSWVAPGTATSVPQGTNPTVDDPGEVGIDTTGNQFLLYGSALRVLDAGRSEAFTFKSPVSGDKAKWRAYKALSAYEIGCVTDAATSVVLDVQSCNANGASCSTILTTTKTCTTTYGSASVSNGSIASGNYVFVSVGTVTGTPGYLYVNFDYTVDRQ